MKLPGSLAAGAVVGLIIGAAATALVLTMRQPDGQDAPEARMGGGRGGYVPAVSIITAEAASVGKTLDVIGEGRALKSVALTSEATGIVDEVNIAPGKRVSEGDVLLRLNDEQQRIALERARAQYPIAKANAERYEDLLNTEAASELEAEAAFNDYKAIEADLRAAQFAVQQRTIRAPFDGVIGLTEIEPGDYVRAGDVVTTLDDTSSIVIEFAVPQEAARNVEIGQKVTARLASGAGAPQEGAVTAIDSRVDPDTRTLRIEATFENEGGDLLPGAVFAVSTTSEGQPAVSVPGLSIQWDRAGPFVWKRGPEGDAVAAPVTILQRTDDIVLVSGEVKPGDLVVWEGADRVRRGSPLPGLTTRQSQPSSVGSANASGPGAAGGSE
ncbi:efflux RND transporter periplasmic adaptor subunit [Hyphococcus sp.]|uniref:efflux RND transporter periplasmic adaptor subunit n=1 Tax=Hyphococcus sp. TaxID=2038636 RepID=UPI0035C6EB06